MIQDIVYSEYKLLAHKPIHIFFDFGSEVVGEIEEAVGLVFDFGFQKTFMNWKNLTRVLIDRELNPAREKSVIICEFFCVDPWENI